MVFERTALLGVQKGQPFRRAAVSDARSFHGTNLNVKIGGAKHKKVTEIGAHSGVRANVEGQ